MPTKNKPPAPSSAPEPPAPPGTGTAPTRLHSLCRAANALTDAMHASGDTPRPQTSVTLETVDLWPMVKALKSFAREEQRRLMSMNVPLCPRFPQCGCSIRNSAFNCLQEAQDAKP